MAFTKLVVIHNIQINQENNIKFTKTISAFSIKKYYRTTLLKALKPTECTKVKRSHIHINVLTLTSQHTFTMLYLSKYIPYDPVMLRKA